MFIVQPTITNADNIMELLLLLDAAKRASAARLTAVVPYFGYGRQDRKDQPRVAIGAKLVANLITAAGADRVVGIDFHQHQIQGFFDLPVDHLYAAPVLTSYFREKNLDDLVVVAPDVGSAKMARGFAKRLGASFAIIDKRRPAANVAEVLNVVGDVEGKTCLVADDMIDTGGTMAQAVHALRDRGGKAVYIAATPRAPVGCGRGALVGCPTGGAGGHQHHPGARKQAVRSSDGVVRGATSGPGHHLYSLQRVGQPALRNRELRPSVRWS